MASRRDELNAYTFAKKRTVAAFLQPSPTGTEEGAPKPLRAIVPGMVVAALVVAGFGAWGMFRPQAPKGWDAPGTRVVVGKQSTTRYVVLQTGKGKDAKTLLHPVLNLASARLLLDPDQFQVVQVADKTLDEGKPPRGPILGIPYAPDRLPSAEEAGRAKRWAVCEQPGGGAGASVQKATFLFAERDLKRTEDAGRLKDGQILYVKGQKGGARFLVDHTGTKYPLKTESTGLLTALVGLGKEPQPVTDDWLATLKDGDEVDFPVVDGRVGTPAEVPGSTLNETENRVGMVLLAQTGSGPQHYVVLPGKVQPVTPFTAWLLINAPQTGLLDMDGRPTTVDASSFDPDPTPFHAEVRWPRLKSTQVNAATGAGARDTVCSVLTHVGEKGETTLTTWAGTRYPADITAGGTSTYVTPGTGLLYTQIQGAGQKAPDGSLFLVTDTGLRYAVQANGDSDSAHSEIGAGDKEKPTDGRPEPSDAQKRLGYEKVTPALVPIAWSEFLSKGPRLDTNSARQPQGS
ncbi:MULTISPECIES: type VII secretion protein EccB [unclassified Streptomyces]|uniref:type VII secretion protein EccB n=1 Tax=unclassified Streptomyces TaxID=2593676 RepID=UPI0016615556|nr:MULTISPECIES: type VII secretion protein EccB [unclassified Streptomyces]MBD0711041.1 type VII secretion protein EccB [Streptomyces sp. CBMA291]MBD0716253.1 type VII secretion protein EccB [Streptomyces sp. CBMA370]